VKKIVALSTLRAQLTGILLPQLADSTASIADTSVPDNEVASDINQADNPDLASGTIAITMYAFA